MTKYIPTPLHGGETFETILDRMMSRVGRRDKREGSIIWDSNASSAIELQLLYLALDDIMAESFGDSASREFLIRRARERNVIPFPATQAIWRGIVTPLDANIAGRRFSMLNTNLTYVVEERIEDELGGWKLRCEQAGDEGNHFFDSIVPLWAGAPRIQTAELKELLVPAQDEESTESLRQRYFDSFNEGSFGGNIRDYQVNVRAIDGIGAVKVTPIWQGGGTVLLTILDAQYNPASSVLVDKVQEIIDPTQDHMGLGLAPIGHVATVRTADTVTVDIAMQLTFSGGFEWGIVRERVIELLDTYMYELRQDWENQDITTPLGFFQNPLVVRISQISNRISNVQGVMDVHNITINGVAANLEIEKYSIPMLGAVIAQ